jgi:DtxR family Mn-dependent transcriptional regulator
MSGVIRLSDALAAGRIGEFLVMRLGENLQTDIEQMEQLHAAGLRPGATIAVAGAAGSAADAKDGTVEVSTAGGSVKLPEETAKHIFVAD